MTTKVQTPLLQRLALFSAIECGNQYWNQQIAEFGIETVYEHLFLGVYSHEKYAKVIEKVQLFNSDKAFSEIDASHSTFLTPDDSRWPVLVDQLPCPPIGLIVRGSGGNS